jgi:hypothetical protein
VDAHAIHGRVDLLEIGDVGSNAEGVAAGVLDLQMRQVQLGFASGEQADPVAGRGETDRQSLSDSTARSRDKHAGIGQSGHARESFQFTLVQTVGDRKKPDRKKSGQTVLSTPLRACEVRKM